MNKFLVSLTSLIIICTVSSALGSSADIQKFALFPEDGSQKVSKWYYSENVLSDFYNENQWNKVLGAFSKEGIKTINAKVGDFFQDIGLFDNKGNLVIQHFPKMYDEENFERYFSGFTQEVFVRGDYGEGYTVNLLQEGDLESLNVEVHRLKNSFLEGGATISGKFSNGDDYIIINHSAFIGMQYYFKDKYSSSITDQFIINLIENDFSLKPGNLIILFGTSHTHLDTFMKALPNGTILLDAPEKRVSILKRIYKKTKNPLVQDYLDYETDYEKTRYKQEILSAKEILEKRFKVVQTTGTFKRYKLINGVMRPKEDVNFFNGVSGYNKNQKQFFITNRSDQIPELEILWIDMLKKFGFHPSNIHFVGTYLGSAGLDCMGSPSP